LADDFLDDGGTMATEPPDAVPQGRQSLSILDAIIVVLLSAACILFLFWIVSRVSDLQVFEDLPDWMTQGFSSVWSSLSTAAAGVGMFTLRYFTHRDEGNPPFLKWIMACVAAFLLFIVATLGIFILANFVKADQKTYPALKNRFLITNETGGKWALKYSVTGRYAIQPGVLKGYVERLSIHADRAGIMVNRITLGMCYTTDGAGWQIFPTMDAQTPNDTVSLGAAIPQDSIFEIKDLAFTIQVPPFLKDKKPWLCAELWDEITKDGQVLAATVPAHSLSREPLVLR
jgi:hypothetical protein